eukprot:1373880-Rhodomonas_salina.1
MFNTLETQRDAAAWAQALGAMSEDASADPLQIGNALLREGSESEHKGGRTAVLARYLRKFRGQKLQPPAVRAGV